MCYHINFFLKTVILWIKFTSEEQSVIEISEYADIHVQWYRCQVQLWVFSVNII